jgi:hypothetical protein
MSASTTCDGCGKVILPTDPELDQWLLLYVPLSPEELEPDPMTNPMAMIAAFANGGGQKKSHYQRLEFCTWKCIFDVAMPAAFSESLTFSAVTEEW